MKAISSRITTGLNIGSIVNAADNSGAKIVRIVGVKKRKGKKGKQMNCGVGDWVKVSVRKGDAETRGKVFDAVLLRQRKPWRRKSGERICFSDNAVALLKDEKGNPKGTQIKGFVPKEISERWKEVSKIASGVV
jgi:large subunit ribosomal protein L14